MKFLLLVGLFCILVTASRAAVSIGFYNDPKHPDKCVVNGLILSPGEEAQEPASCGRMICGGNGMVNFHSCGTELPPPGFKLGEPIMPDAHYPECCKKSYVKIF